MQTDVSGARPGSRLVSLIVVAVGLGLLGGGAAAYYYIVQRPLTWPTTDAVVVSSRVVNPLGPTDHQPEIVFLLASEMREVRTIPSWSSGSYDMVRAYVERFPAGTAMPVAVNPADPSDVRYELGPTFTNMILPGVLGLMGLIFASVGLVTLRRPRTGANAGRGTLRWVSALFTVIGLTLGGIGAWLFTLETPLSWPTVNAEAVEGTVREVGSSSRGRNSERTYVIQVTFRYTIDGKTITSQTTSGSGFSSRRHRRIAPRHLRARLDATTSATAPRIPTSSASTVTRFSVYVLPGALLAMGLSVPGFGLADAPTCSAR